MKYIMNWIHWIPHLHGSKLPLTSRNYPQPKLEFQNSSRPTAVTISWTPQTPRRTTAACRAGLPPQEAHFLQQLQIAATVGVHPISSRNKEGMLWVPKCPKNPWLERKHPFNKYCRDGFKIVLTLTGIAATRPSPPEMWTGTILGPNWQHPAVGSFIRRSSRGFRPSRTIPEGEQQAPFSCSC